MAGGEEVKHICVYASSSDALDACYFAAARAFGALLARRGGTLIFGGGCIGLMGEAARAVHAGGGRVVGVIPDRLVLPGVAYESADELIVTPDMRTRKATMEARAEAFVALPGGIGTLEEVLEVMVLKQLRYHAKPIVFLNVDGFYKHLIGFLDHQIEARFAKPSMRSLYHVVETPEAVFTYLDAYAAPTVDDRLF